jgi:hypothetical protein
MSSPSALSAEEALDVARGNVINHSAVSQLVKEGKPEHLILIIFNSSTHDELKFKALRKIADLDNTEFDLKTKLHLVSESLRKNNFGNELYFEGKKLLGLIYETQQAAVGEVIREHIAYLLNSQAALDDIDFQAIKSEIDLLQSAHNYGLDLGKGVLYPSFWKYILLVKWASLLEVDEELSTSLNNSLIEELEPLTALENWHFLDANFEDPLKNDSLIYSSVHRIFHELRNDIGRTKLFVEEANEILQNYDWILSKVEDLVTRFEKQRTEKQIRHLAEIQYRQKKREDSDRQRPETISSSPFVFKDDATINNRWI